MQRPIYLDYMATTPVDDRAVTKMVECLGKEGCFGNPASQSHRYGFEAAERVRRARKQVADLVHADPREIVWTSGATESNNLAIKGAAGFYQRQGKHIITMSTEHKAVLDPCIYLASHGFEVTYLDPESSGLLNLETLKKAIRSDTLLISIMCVNNETGVLQDIAAIGEVAREHGILFHVDAAQAAGKVSIDLQNLKVDLMSFSGHKNYGPKGIGALYVRRNPPVQLEPSIHGGGHERGMRSGTLATHQIVGMGEAFALSAIELEEDAKRITAKRERFLKSVMSLGGISLNGDALRRVPGCLNLSVQGITGESLVMSLRDIAISNGSACNSANPAPSHVLSAMGLSREQAYSSLRISLGRFTTDEDVDHASAHFKKEVMRLREMSPVWDLATSEAIRKSG